MSQQVIYIPGIGDHRPHGQDKALQLFRLFSIHAHYFPLGWNKREEYSAKHSQLLAKIDELTGQGHTVSLIGVSAGASAALNAYAARMQGISKVVCVSGKINHRETIRQPTYDVNPDFRAAMLQLDESLKALGQNERARILSTHPWRDEVVPVRDTIISGATEMTLPGFSHVTGIFFAMTIGVPRLARFIKRTA